MFDKLSLLDNSTEMSQAIRSKTFFVVAIPLISGYSIGAADESLPSVYATLEMAQKDNNEIAEEYAQQIVQGEREEDDEWDGEVMMAQWDGGDDMTLATACGEHLLTTRPWREMAGL